MWLRLFEQWLVVRLLSSPSFHRAVRQVHARVQRTIHGIPPEEMGGTNIEKPDNIPDTKKLFKYFTDELKDQLKGGSSKK